MRHNLSLILGLGTLLLTIGLIPVTQDAGAQEAKKAKDPFAEVKDDPNLPRVLLIGDSISIGYTLDVREMLKDKANVHRPAANCRSTNHGFESIDGWLGDGNWNVIHFNWGLHDMAYLTKEGVDPKKARPEDTYQQVPVEQYEKNLEKLVERLKKTGATLIWCSTTPVPEGAARRKSTDAPIYNKAALKVMQKHNIQVNDLYSFALPQLDKIQRPKNVHFTPAGSKVLAEKVASSIRGSLRGE